MRLRNIAIALTLLIVCTGVANAQKSNPYFSHTDTKKLNVSNAEWKKILPAEVYKVAREQDTEPAFHNKYWNNHETGIYYCAVCGNPLFSSKTKFNSGTGWPSFTATLDNNSVRMEKDNSLDMVRTEVQCARCGSHLGHLFDDGPAPTHKRYCMNSAVLDLVPAK